MHSGLSTYRDNWINCVRPRHMQLGGYDECSRLAGRKIRVVRFVSWTDQCMHACNAMHRCSGTTRQFLFRNFEMFHPLHFPGFWGQGKSARPLTGVYQNTRPDGDNFHTHPGRWEEQRLIRRSPNMPSSGRLLYSDDT